MPCPSFARVLFRPLRSAAPLLALVASPAWAQDDIDIDTISRLADIVRWGGVITSLFVVAGAWMLLRLLGRFVAAFGSEFSSRRLTLHKVSTIGQFVIYVATTLLVLLLSFRVDETTLAVIGGTVAVAVGFAMKDLVASFIAGVIVMLDRPFQVGDRVNFGGEYGDITAIGLRSVRMQTLDDNTVTIPNSKFLSDVTSSGNYGALDMQVVMDFHIAADQDIERAREIVNEAVLSSRYVFLAKPVVILVNQWVSDYLVGVRLRLKAYVLDTRFEKAFESDVNLRVLRAFQHEGILTPGQPRPAS
ncbi:mechanosensitive ion channel family protein [Novosphingobium decolorationis]|uniref:Small-conductance mechanosensitive channel n=1 Tax=Novosphingobium decolorationis TaxID=2698673 RepID=A0ABX8E1E8_9SPHN|nr:mechanosensitive ion channel domain-containing protein [Novosphingobium decolorationis]MED5545413.1 mechanosensitive ion channel domain-containing protein [Pseudomonadota bacterium]QVM82748.1 mechanosensitive ion channel [Novosphingobium decolorationis]